MKIMKTPEKRKQKLLLVLPLLLLPFIALAFWALGGGKANPADAEAQASPGINKTLPGAQLKGQKAQDKMMLYDQAQRDSASAKLSNGNNAFAALGWDTVSQHKALAVNNAQANEVKINKKLAEINRQISQPEPVASYPNTRSYTNTAPVSPDIDRLEKLMKQKQQATEPDPEMEQLNTMLDKIMKIQNPGPVPDKSKAVQAVAKDSAFKAIPAMIDGNQKVAPGGVVKLRLSDTLHINGIAIPKGQLLFGSCAVTNQRLLLDIKNIRLGTAIIPVNLTVFSLDGMQAAPVMGA